VCLKAGRGDAVAAMLYSLISMLRES